MNHNVTVRGLFRGKKKGDKELIPIEYTCNIDGVHLERYMNKINNGQNSYYAYVKKVHDGFLMIKITNNEYNRILQLKMRESWEGHEEIDGSYIDNNMDGLEV